MNEGGRETNIIKLDMKKPCTVHAWSREGMLLLLFRIIVFLGRSHPNLSPSSSAT